MLNGIVFDLDGVIVNSHPAHKRSWRLFLNTLGKETTENDLNFILEGRKREDILKHFLGDLTDEEIRSFGKRKDEFFQTMAGDVPPVAGAPKFIEELGSLNIPCAIATSASRRRTRFTLESLGLMGQFKAVVTGDDVSEGKPDPAIYLMAARRLGLPPNNLVAIEDAPAGVQAATAAGMCCIGVGGQAQRARLRSAGASIVIPDFLNISFAQLRDSLGVPVVSTCHS